MTAAAKVELISIETYLAGELLAKQKHEYAGGYIYAMAGGRNAHNSISVAFVSILYAKLRGKKCQPFNSDTKVRVQLPTHTRFYYPDGMVVCDSNPPADTFQDRPVIIAEVLSQATRRIDEGEKREAYLTIPTLGTYLLIDSSRPRVTAYQRTGNGFVASLYEGLNQAIPLPDIDGQLALAELYERAEFEPIDPAPEE